MNTSISEDDAGLIEDLAAIRGVPVHREKDLYFSAVAVIESGGIIIPNRYIISEANAICSI